MAKNGPVPQPGILDISPYVPGESSVPGGVKPIKLSSNETPLGPSPKAVAAYKAVADELDRYPDGAATALRDAIARQYGLNPDRIVCGSGSDELINLIAHAYVGPGDEAVYSEHGFLMYKIATLASGGQAGVRAGDGLQGRRRCDPGARHAEDQDRLPRQPQQPHRHLPSQRGGAPPAQGAARQRAARASTRPTREYVRRNDYEAGLELVATTDNTVMTRTFSKIYGLAALRLGWAYCPAAVADVLNRMRGPFNVNAPAIAAGVAALADRAHIETAVAHNEKWLPWVTAEIEKLGLEVTPSVGNFVLIHFADAEGQDAAAADEFLKARGIILRRVGAYGLPDCLRMTIGTETTTTRWWPRWRASWGGHDGADVRARGADRHRADRVVARATPCGGAGWRAPSSAMRRARRRATPRCGWAWSSSVYATAAEAARGADLVILCTPVGACGAARQGDGAEPEAGRHPDRRRLGQGRGAARRGPARARGRAFHPRPSDRRHRAFRPRIRLCRAVRRPLVRADPARGRRQGRGRQARRVLARVRHPRRDHGRAAPRPGARHHQPRAAPHRLQHRQHRAATWSASPTPR